jgi:hypothetical protein
MKKDTSEAVAKVTDIGNRLKWLSFLHGKT